MLSPRLTNCPECANIPSLIAEIDCKLADLASNLYNNVVYMLNQPVPGGTMLDLLNYRRILTYKYCNPNYLGSYRVRSLKSVQLDLLNAINNIGIKGVHFWDSDFMSHSRRAQRIMNHLQEYEIKYSIMARSDNLDKYILQNL